MKKILLALLIPFFVFGTGSVYAQMMDSSVVENDHTAQEEAEGKEIWSKLQNKEVECAGLTEEQFGALGEYFMGQMLGDSHSSMNAMMMNMMGEEGEKQMHVAMGKRLSGCDPNAAYSVAGSGFMPMMNMMGGWSFGNAQDRSTPSNLSNNTMMGNYNGSWDGGVFGGMFMLFWWILLIVGIIALVKWIMNQSSDRSRGRSPLEILKERYARGEIDKQDFEERRKELER